MTNKPGLSLMTDDKTGARAAEVQGRAVWRGGGGALKGRESCVVSEVKGRAVWRGGGGAMKGRAVAYAPSEERQNHVWE